MTKSELIAFAENNFLFRMTLSKSMRAKLNGSVSENKRLSYVIDLLKNAKLLNQNEDLDELHYQAATIYTLLMSKSERRKKAAYFTPPVLSKYLISTVESYGVNLKNASVLDPAAGGAAFLSCVAYRMSELGCNPKSIIKRLSGIEIDSGLAKLAEHIVFDRLNYKDKRFIKINNSLHIKPKSNFSLVLANPPYGRILKPSKSIISNFREVIDPTHVNLYVLFIFISVLHARIGGLIGLIVPLSFIGVTFPL